MLGQVFNRINNNCLRHLGNKIYIFVSWMGSRSHRVGSHPPPPPPPTQILLTTPLPFPLPGHVNIAELMILWCWHHCHHGARQEGAAWPLYYFISVQLQSWTKVLGTAWKYDMCSLIALFSTLWRVTFAQSDVPPSPLVNVALKKCTFSPLIQHWEGEGGRGKSKRGHFQRKSAGVPTLLSRIVDTSPSYFSWIYCQIQRWLMVEVQRMNCRILHFRHFDLFFCCIDYSCAERGIQTMAARRIVDTYSYITYNSSLEV